MPAKSRVSVTFSQSNEISGQTLYYAWRSPPGEQNSSFHTLSFQMELEWSRVFYSFYYFLGYFCWHLENIRQKIQIYSDALHCWTAIHVMSSKGFMNLAALKPYIPHWTLYNNVGINSTRTNPEGDSQRCRKGGMGKLQESFASLVFPSSSSRRCSNSHPGKSGPIRCFHGFVWYLWEGDIWDFCFSWGHPWRWQSWMSMDSSCWRDHHKPLGGVSHPQPLFAFQFWICSVSPLSSLIQHKIAKSASLPCASCSQLRLLWHGLWGSWTPAESEHTWTDSCSITGVWASQVFCEFDFH